MGEKKVNKEDNSVLFFISSIKKLIKQNFLSSQYDFIDYNFIDTLFFISASC
jgi:hypothetical protein